MTHDRARISVKLDLEYQGAVYFSGPPSPYPGWYCEHFREEGRGEVHRLWTEDPDAVQEAIQEAAQRIGCLPEQILRRVD